MLNKIILQGRLVAAPESRNTQTGKQVAQFRIASERSRTDANGQRQVDFLTCIAWQKTGEFICKWFGKGDMILVTGRMESRSYTDKAGQNRTAYEVVVETADFCGKSGQNGQSGQNSASQTESFTPVADDEDLPF